MKTLMCASAVMFALSQAIDAPADDRWENGGFASDDSAGNTKNELRHGTVQVGHDLEGTAAIPDQDWMMVRVQAGHSYEARVLSGTTGWTNGAIVNLAVFDRVAANGSVLTTGVSDGAVNPFDAVRPSLSVHWIAASDETQFLRTRGDTNINLTAADQYDVELYDTTCFVPRFNNSATQLTVLIVQNTRTSTVTGEINFYDAGGALLSTQAMSLPARGGLVIATSTIPALAGQAGFIQIAHTGGYGALAGKAVALEPATGFTFDTGLSSLPR